jgi:hypothetical protein
LPGRVSSIDLWAQQTKTELVVSLKKKVDEESVVSFVVCDLCMSLLDLHRLDRYNQIRKKGALSDEVNSIKLLKYTGLVCGRLWLWKYRQKPSAMPADISAILLLERCQDAEENIITELTAK